MRQLLVTILLAGLIPTGAVFASEQAPTARQQIQSALNDMLRAANAHDTGRYMALFAHQPSLVFAANGEVFHGWDALHAQQLKWWQNGKSTAVYTEVGKAQFLPLAGNLVVTTSPLAARRTLPDGSTSAGHFVVTSIWRKLPEGWRIVYGHESWAK